MSTVEARQRGHKVRLARMAAQGRCFCGHVEDRGVGKRCSRCTYRKKLLARQRYTKPGSTYGFAFTVAMIARSTAVGTRGWA